jgi:transcriptional regulator with XRE-family HTH domain
MATKSPKSVDKHVGLRLRQQRHARGLSQQELADLVGISFQQIQKYESGTNRVSASRLQQFADALQVRPVFFFDRTPAAIAKNRKGIATIEQFVSTREGTDLSQAFMKIADKSIRRGIVKLVERIAGR